MSVMRAFSRGTGALRSQSSKFCASKKMTAHASSVALSSPGVFERDEVPRHSFLSKLNPFGRAARKADNEQRKKLEALELSALDVISGREGQKSKGFFARRIHKWSGKEVIETEIVDLLMLDHFSQLADTLQTFTFQSNHPLTRISKESHSLVAGE